MKTLLAASIAAVLMANAASAQDRPTGALEATAGWAGFVDEETINHTLIGAAAKWYVSPRVAVGPELVYMIGPRSDRDLMLTGNVTVDFVPGRAVTPFVVAGGGLFRHSDDFGARGKFSSTEGAFTAGLGARIALGDRWYLAPEARLGWELHTRLSVAAGYRW